MSSIPDTWVACKLGDVVDYGSTVKAEPAEIPEDAWILELEDIEKDTSQIVQRLSFKERKSKSTKSRFSEGDVLYGKLRPYLNKVVIADRPGFCTTEIIPIKSGQHLDPRFVFRWLKHPTFLAYVTAVSHGLNMPRLGTESGKAAPFVLAPLPEQKRIADKLEAVLGRVDACRARLARVPDLLKRFRQSVLAAATSGRLTEDWRESNSAKETGGDVVARDSELKRELIQREPGLAKKKSTIESEINTEYVYEIPGSWVFSTWGKVSEWITYGFTRPMPASPTGVKQVTAKDVLNFSLQLENSRFTTAAAFDELSEKDKPRKGDLLVTKDGTIGRAALVDSDETFCINQSVAVCWLRTTTMSKRYLEIIVNADFTQQFIADHAQGMAIQHLSIADFSHCPLPVPPLKEQHEIARRVDCLFKLADRIESRLNDAQTTVDRLTPSTLAKAFRGELVPQDPNDEPASALLARIRAERAAAPTPKRRGRRAKVV